MRHKYSILWLFKWYSAILKFKTSLMGIEFCFEIVFESPDLGFPDSIFPGICVPNNRNR